MSCSSRFLLVLMGRIDIASYWDWQIDDSGSNYDISLKRSLWRCYGRVFFCSCVLGECCSIWPGSKLWDCAFDKINSRTELMHSGKLLLLCPHKNDNYLMWYQTCESGGSVTGSHFLFALVKSYEQEGDHYLYFKTYFESNEVRWHYLLNTLSYWWQQMALFSISKSPSFASVLSYYLCFNLLWTFYSAVM